MSDGPRGTAGEGASRQAARRADHTTGPLIEITMPVEGEHVEPVVELFEQHGLGTAIETRMRDERAGGAAQPRTFVRTWVRAEDIDARTRIEQGLWHLGRIVPLPEAELRQLAEANWAERWKDHWTAQEVGPFVVAPSWLELEVPGGRTLMRLDPGSAFGTGQHPTSRLCLGAVADALAAQPGASLLDVGTGSGILAIGAALRGAGTVVGIDIDPRAVEAAIANAAANGVRLETQVGGIEELPRGACFDVVVANILAPIIVELAPALWAHCMPGGLLIASGILDEQGDQVASALGRAGFEEPVRRAEGDWLVMEARRPQSECTARSATP